MANKNGKNPQISLVIKDIWAKINHHSSWSNWQRCKRWYLVANLLFTTVSALAPSGWPWDFRMSSTIAYRFLPGQYSSESETHLWNQMLQVGFSAFRATVWPWKKTASFLNLLSFWFLFRKMEIMANLQLLWRGNETSNASRRKVVFLIGGGYSIVFRLFFL